MTQTIIVWGVLSEPGKRIYLGGVGKPEWYPEKGKEIYEALKAVLAPAVMESLVEEVIRDMFPPEVAAAAEIGSFCGHGE